MVSTGQFLMAFLVSSITSGRNLVHRFHWVRQLLKTSGLTWVIVLLPRNKIPKLMSESVSRGPWYEEIFTILILVLSKVWGNEKAGNANVQSNSVWWWRQTPGTLQHHRQRPADRGGPLSNTWNSLSIPALGIERKIHRITNVQVIYTVKTE